MLEKILGLESDQKIDFTIGWSHGAAVALILITLAVVFSVYLYRSERQPP